MLGGPPNLLVALGLIILYPRLATRTRLLARVGYFFTVIGLVVSGSIDLYIGAIAPPFFAPIVGIGLILMALGVWHNPRLQRQSCYLLMTIGIFFGSAIAWFLILPLEVFDQVDGYRWYGLQAHVVPGIGWVVLGASFWKTQAPSAIEPA
jgi:hypothetical protein